VDSIENQAVGALTRLLGEIPVLHIENIERQPGPADSGIDFLVRVTVSGQEPILACEVKQNGQPRYVRNAIFRTLTGMLVSLGRGGSDLSAVLFAHGLEAIRCELINCDKRATQSPASTERPSRLTPKLL